eukprot:gnl/TRDRNA2_/TRDRNA2_130841_c0_seq2.p1 gnl/TRDRNA2_/TRDRNA2_130841_c0~~gnl/TRDRNA2_/TRDRNA2_130841_c0_seq2.p1  ORF type:complete len:405 (+),score=128.24 gnl/TRDRNA2_/TRDRNA2_130841_c0_seq2:92-1306(+)
MADALEKLKISDDKKRYILETLNPLLEQMMADCIHHSPQDPVPFMLDWMENKRVMEEDRKLTNEEREKVTKENAELEDTLAKLKGQAQEAAMAVAADAAAEEEEEEEEADDEEPPDDFFQNNSSTTKMRTSVSAEAYGDWNQKKTFVPPVVLKSDDQKERLKKCLGTSFLFSGLEEQDLAIVIGAMREVVLEVGQRVINQGESGDFLFVVESGKLDCVIKGTDGTEKVVKSCEAGDVFGELALLYNCPRAASVESREACTLWQLDRETFNHIVKEAAQKKRNRYNVFLGRVPIFAAMDDYERSQVADALRSESFSDGKEVIKQGDKGDKFFILEEGEAIASKDGQKVYEYSVGDYFGELALIQNQPRAASVLARGQLKVLSLDRKAFKRLLDVSALLERTSKYM